MGMGEEPVMLQLGRPKNEVMMPSRATDQSMAHIGRCPDTRFLSALLAVGPAGAALSRPNMHRVAAEQAAPGQCELADPSPAS